MNMDENNLWGKFTGCDCLKEILKNSGYDNKISLSHMNEDNLDRLENFVDENRQIIQNLQCSHADTYKTQKKFKILSGHRILVLKWCELLNNEIQSTETFNINDSAFSPILREIIFHAKKNANTTPNLHRFSELLIDFSIYLYIMAGKATYEIMAANLPLPKAKTIANNIYRNKERIIEGKLRTEELVTHLNQSGYPKKVFLSEDGSGVVQKIVYDSRTNQLIGLVLPMNEENGMPKLFSFKATSAEEIKRCLEFPQSKLVYIVVAQALQFNAIPFILQIFGTTNEFKAADVQKRWLHTKDELKKCDIDVVGYSSDGDPRLLSAMKNTMRLDFVPHIDVLKLMVERLMESDIDICTQDSIHIGVKLRNVLLNSSIVLRMGKKIVSATHINVLIKTVSKEVHALVCSNLFPQDRQNYKSVEKLMDQRVLDALKNHVPDSEATAMFLFLCRYITSAYEQHDLPTTDRVYRIWFAVYFIRCWRKWIITTKGFTLTDNFITSNCYACIEINAQALIELILKLRAAQSPSMFLPRYFSSQRCEQTFRQMRSLGTSNFTKINFNIFELLHMISRIELMNKIIFSHKEIDSPRIKPQTTSSQSSSSGNTGVIETFPSDTEILQAVINARNDALAKAIEFGIQLTPEDIVSCDIPHMMESVNETLSEDLVDHFNILSGQEDDYDEHQNASERKDADLHTIEVIDSEGQSKNMKKSHFLWSLTKTNDKLSSDRTKRVQQSSKSEPSSKRFKSNEDQSGAERFFFKSENLQKGDWAVFHVDAAQRHSSENCEISKFENYLIGMVIGFRYFEITTRKKKTTKYKLEYAPTSSKVEKASTSRGKDEETSRSIQVLGVWYHCEENGTLTPNQNIDMTADLTNYVATLQSPIPRGGNDSNASSNVSYILPFEYSDLKKKLNIF